MRKEKRRAEEGTEAAIRSRDLTLGSVAKGNAKLVHAPHRVRIIGGSYKRTPIAVLDSEGLRPTPDRVRETLFNWLSHLLPDIKSVRGLDLFAGTGALGFELASRGAEHVVLIEAKPRVVERLQALKAKLEAPVEIIVGDAFAAMQRLAPASFDIIFIDPPFEKALLQPALEAAFPLLKADGLIYAESGSALEIEADKWSIVRQDKAGQVFFYLLRRASA